MAESVRSPASPTPARSAPSPKPSLSRPETAAPVAEPSVQRIVLDLQRAIGNQGTSSSGLLQPKLRIGAADDPLEQEADRTAEAMVRESWSGLGPPISELGRERHDEARRKCDPCAEEDTRVQPKTLPGDPAAHRGAAAEASVDRLGSGRALPPAVRSFFEPRFQHDFGAVRVHTGPLADRAAQAIHARAFTFGHDIAFAAGEFAPDSRPGRRLLAHELTHVIQQTPRVARRQPMPQPELGQPSPSEAGSAAEVATSVVPERAPAGETASLDRLPDSEAGVDSEATAGAGVIVDDDTQPGPGQMTKSTFLAEVRDAVCAAADQAFAGTEYSTEGCPWIEATLRFYERRSAARIERDLSGFVPSSETFDSSRDYIPFIAERARRSVETWVATGEIGDLPSGLPGSRLAGSLAGPLATGSAGLLFKAKAGGPRGSAPPQAVQTQLGEGQPLEGSLRSRMESTFGSDFSSVRIHRDAVAARLSNRFDASAFTVGRDIAFGAGQYRPGSVAGEALIAHELAHVVQQESARATAPSTGAGSRSLEEDADRAAIGAVSSLYGATEQGRSTARSAGPRLASGLRLQRCGSSREFRSRPDSGNYVELLNSHRLKRYGSDRQADPLWVPGASDHAAAYTKGTQPNVAARLSIGSGGALRSPGTSSVSVRVKEGGSVRGSRTGLDPRSGSLELTGLSLTGLTGSGDVRQSRYSFDWEASADGTTWLPLTTTGPHLIYWLYDSPKTSPLYTTAVEKATRYAAGRSAAQPVAAALRSGIRGIDGLAYDPSDAINQDPLSVYRDGTGICTDYSNLLTLLALSAGLNANAVLYFGGFQSVGRNIWVTLAPSFLTLLNVSSPNPAFNPTYPAASPLAALSPSGHAFTYHAISRIEGVLHDAALDRVGVSGAAVHDGKIVRLVEIAGTTLPAATRGAAYSARIARRGHLVGVTTRNYAQRIPASAFAGDFFGLPAPLAAPSPIDVPVSWSLASGTLPPGLSLNPATGVISGTPTTAGTFPITVRVAAPNMSGTGIERISPLSLTVT